MITRKRAGSRIGATFLLPIILAAGMGGGLVPTHAAEAPGPPAWGPPVRISAPTTAGQCDPGASPADKGLDEEPTIAADPRRPNNLVAAWMANAVQAIEAAWSDDGGRRWHAVMLPGLTQCSGGGRPPEATLVYDVWLSIGPDGTTYLIAKPSAAGGTVSELTVSVSHDDGHTWADPVVVQGFDGLYNDKPMIVADAVRPGFAYAVFNIQEPPVVGPTATMLSRTTDGGISWSTPSQIHLFQGEETSHLLAFSDGSVEDLLVDETAAVRARTDGAFTGPSQIPVLSLRSTDAGLTWSAPRAVVSYSMMTAHIGTTPYTGYVAPGAVFGAASDQNRGWIAYQEADAGATEPQRIEMVDTADSGKTWSAPRLVAAGGTPFYAMVAGRANHVAVGFFRWGAADAAASSRATDLVARVSDDGGLTWSEQHLDGPFKEPPSPRDYQSGALAGNTAGFAYGHAAPGSTNAMDIFFAAVRFLPARDATRRVGEATSPPGLPNTSAEAGSPLALLLAGWAVLVLVLRRDRVAR